LNEWVRFTKPGEYKLMVASDRVEILDSSEPHGKRPVTASSNTITLKIIAADPAWERRVFSDAVAKLKAAESANRKNRDRFNPARLEAAETLRFLGTADAVRELVRQMGDENSQIQGSCFFGVIASPDRALAREALAEALAAPDFPITENFFDALQEVEPNESGRDSKSKETQRTIFAKVVDALPNKRDAALRVTLYTILHDVWVRGDAQLLPPEIKQRLIKQLIQRFDQLSMDQQALILEDRWQDIKDPALLPLLKRFVEIDFTKISPENSTWARDLPALALRRWLDLDAAGARQAIIAEMTRDPVRFQARDLSLLPDETLPEVEQALADHFVAAKDYSLESTNLATLIARYATKAVLPQILKKLDHQSGNSGCNVQEHILGYLLRCDPAAALPHIEKSIANRRKPANNDCMNRVLTAISNVHYDPVLEGIAIRLLEDSNLSFASDAAAMLEGFGSPSTEEVLWRTYEKWSKRWEGRERELNFAAELESNSRRSSELAFGQVLFRALAGGQAWFTDEAKLHRLRSMNKVKAIEALADEYLRRWQNPPLRIDITGGRGFHASVAHYEFSSMDRLKEKLVQFPPGTKFLLWPVLTDPESISDLRNFVQSHGMSLEERKISE
jgi:hypothetical protein